MKIHSAAECRFFSPEDACRWSLAAYYSTVRATQPFRDSCGDEVIAEPSDFAERFVGELEARLALHAIRATGQSLAVSSAWNLEALLSAAGVDFIPGELNGLPVPENPGNNREHGDSRDD